MLHWALNRVHSEKFHLLQRSLQRDWASKVVHSSLSTVHWALYVHWANLHVAVWRASTNLIACNALQLCEPMRNCAFMHFKCQIYFANIVINSHTPYNPLNTSTHFMDCTQTFLLCTRAMHCATKICKCPKSVGLLQTQLPFSELPHCLFSWLASSCPSLRTNHNVFSKPTIVSQPLWQGEF